MKFINRLRIVKLHYRSFKNKNRKFPVHLVGVSRKILHYVDEKCIKHTPLTREYLKLLQIVAVEARANVEINFAGAIDYNFERAL